MTKVLLTGAAGYIADQLLPTFRERYETVLVDVNDTNRRGERVEGVVIQDLIDPDRGEYAGLFEGVDAVVHLGYKRRSGDPLDHFFDEKENVEMAYNVFRSAYDAGASRVVMASSNHAADWYEHSLIHARKMESLDPYRLPLSDNFYGWAKATYEHMGFLFACGAMDFQTAGGGQDHTGASQAQTRKLEVVMVRIGAPRDLDPATYAGDPGNYKRDLGAYISPRDLTQLFTRGDRGSEHRERTRDTLAGGVRDKRQHAGVLVSDERAGRAGLRAGGRFGGEVRRGHPADAVGRRRRSRRGSRIGVGWLGGIRTFLRNRAVLGSVGSKSVKFGLTRTWRVG